jgi:hypothetical protein
MKPLLFMYQLFVMAPVILGQSFGLNLADISGPDGWTAQALGPAGGYLMLVGWIGLLLTIVGYKLFDNFMPKTAAGKSSNPDPETGG